MTDIEIAKRILGEENYVIAIIKNGEVLFKSCDKGIRPLFEAYKILGINLNGASIADKVTGRAAAIICDYFKISNLYSGIISNYAIDILEDSNVNFEFEKKVNFIMNRTKTDMCPVEKLSKNIRSGDELLKKIAVFLAKE